MYGFGEFEKKHERKNTMRKKYKEIKKEDFFKKKS